MDENHFVEGGLASFPTMIPECVERFEDMSPRGRLRLIKQDDGDIVAVVSDPRDGGESASVEFCSCGGGGGKSPRTLKALRDLMVAMAEDNADPTMSSRRGELT